MPRLCSRSVRRRALARTRPAQQASFQLGNSFLDLLLDPFADGRNGFLSPGGGSAIGFADEEKKSSLPAEVASAYAMATKAPVTKAPASRPWNIWAASYGGYGRTSGDIAGTGNQQTISRAYGFASGLDYRLPTGTTVGFALAGAYTSWGLSGNLGDGHGDAFQAGIYANHWFNRVYLSGAAAFTYYRMSTDRTEITDQLSADYNANSFGGRIEGGYLIPTVALDVTPYAAFQAQSFHTPSYSETASSGSPAFALNFTSRDATALRTELGARFDKRLVTDAGLLTLFGRLAWAHDNTDDPTLNTTLAASPATTFVVNGTQPASNLALVAVGADLKLLNNWSAAAKIGGEFGDSTESYDGWVKVAYRW
jgi:outer membrane autotransporter protein